MWYRRRHYPSADDSFASPLRTTASLALCALVKNRLAPGRTIFDAHYRFDSNKVSENYTVKGDKIRNNENLCRNKPITEHTHNQKSVWMKRSRVGAHVKYLPCWTSPTPRRMIYIKNSVGTSDHQHRDSRNNIIGIRTGNSVTAAKAPVSTDLVIRISQLLSSSSCNRAAQRFGHCE